MQYRQLGTTGLLVSRLCFGTLTLGPLQAALDLKEGAALLQRALASGVNFWDTAEIYRTYPYIRLALAGHKHEVVIASKSYAATAAEMERSLTSALRGIERDYIDIFLLHEQESYHTLRGHWPALEYLIRAKEKGWVRAVGISTHAIGGVVAARSLPEIDVIHPLINKAGIGIIDGTAEEMRQAITEAALWGKGMYGMKALGGGHLLGQAEEALFYVLEIEQLAAVAVGMQSEEELDFNLHVFSGCKVPSDLRQKVERRRRRLHIEEWCTGCGQCTDYCSAGALKVQNGYLRVDLEKCRLCGYCGRGCRYMALKIV